MFDILKTIVTVTILTIASILGCTAVLDFASLQTDTSKDEKIPVRDTDSEIQVLIPCNNSSDCDDNIACTKDRCGPNSYCVFEPDNNVCDGFLVCKLDQGCVDIGRECLTPADCGDGILCKKYKCNSAGKCEMYLLDDNACLDPNNLCFLGAKCDSEQGCVGGYEKPCTQVDGPFCYNYMCSPSTGKCDTEVFRPGADNDSDGHCDKHPDFGGNDCDDRDDQVYVGAQEICNNKDNDCDGITDASITFASQIISETGTVYAASSAVGQNRPAAAWQVDAENESSVLLQILPCLSDCSDDQTIKSEVYNISKVSGMSGNAGSPSISFISENFVITWIQEDTDGMSSKAYAMEFELGENNTVSFGSPKIISSIDAVRVFSPKVDKLGDTWIAAFAAQYEDGTFAIEIAGHNLHSLISNPILGEMTSLSMTCKTSDKCILVFSAKTNVDEEIYETYITRNDNNILFSNDSFKLISDVSDTVGDVSSNPYVAWYSDDKWAVAYTDKAGPPSVAEPETNFNIRGLASGIAADIILDKSANLKTAGLVFDGERFGLLYIRKLQTTEYLEFALLESNMIRTAEQQTVLAKTLPGQISFAELIYTGKEFVVLWNEKTNDLDAENDTLRLTAFTSCHPQTR